MGGGTASLLLLTFMAAVGLLDTTVRALSVGLPPAGVQQRCMKGLSEMVRVSSDSLYYAYLQLDNEVFLTVNTTVRQLFSLGVYPGPDTLNSHCTAADQWHTPQRTLGKEHQRTVVLESGLSNVSCFVFFFCNCCQAVTVSLHISTAARETDREGKAGGHAAAPRVLSGMCDELVDMTDTWGGESLRSCFKMGHRKQSIWIIFCYNV